FTLAASPSTGTGEMVERAFDVGWTSAVLKTMAVEREEVNLVYPMIAGLDHTGERLLGMENIDLISDRSLKDWERDIARLKQRYPKNVVIASIMASSREDWQEAARRVEGAGADMIECSFSCPHGMPERGMGSVVGQNAELTERTARWVKEAVSIPVVIKLTPNVTDIVHIAEAVKKSGADGVCAINTVKTLLGIDIETMRPFPTVAGLSTYGGYSGPPIKPVALKCVAEIAKQVDIDISGVGGVTTWQDAVEFMLVGARNVQICTAVMKWGYRLIEDLIDGLSYYLVSKNLSSPEELVGKSLAYIAKHEDLSRDYRVVAHIDESLCLRDGRCYIACRDGGHEAIKMSEDRLPVVDEDRCLGCGLCTTVCPVRGCITLREKR
ncbi:MAG TPA: NAD-dependent dihydropyrimidine dehydrogenase subunit PreA, partial [Firmicutes bacterium]|nr:NAD-dependent dihydropyrimidine dehydrogenase subunit PreA [Bacillota bacterium]